MQCQNDQAPQALANMADFVKIEFFHFRCPETGCRPQTRGNQHNDPSSNVFRLEAREPGSAGWLRGEEIVDQQIALAKIRD